MADILDMPLREVIKRNVLVYINEDPYGVGCLYVNGKRITGLQEVTINAHTTDNSQHFMKLGLQVAPTALDAKEVE